MALYSAVLSDLETFTPVDPQLDSPLLDDGDHDRFSHYARKSDICLLYTSDAADE